MRTMIATLGQIIEMGDFKGVLISCQNVISRRDFFSTVENNYHWQGSKRKIVRDVGTWFEIADSKIITTIRLKRHFKGK